MLKCFYILIWIAVFKLCFCQLSVGLGNESILGKKYLVYFVKSAYSEIENDAWLCAGAIVSPSQILTAAACLVEVNRIYAIAGNKKYVNGRDIEKDKCANTWKKKIVKISVPKEYTTSTANQLEWMNVDIGVATVQEPYKFNDQLYLTHCSYEPDSIRINFDKQNEKENTRAIALGWGGKKVGSKKGTDKVKVKPKLLQEATTTIIKKSFCSKLKNGSTELVNEYLLCASGNGFLGENDDESTSNFTVEEQPSLVLINTTKNTNESDEMSSRKSSLLETCQNDHGGPLITWVGTEEVALGVALNGICNPNFDCVGPRIYVSTAATAKIIECLLETDDTKRKTCNDQIDDKRYQVMNVDIKWPEDLKNNFSLNTQQNPEKKRFRRQRNEEDSLQVRPSKDFRSFDEPAFPPEDQSYNPFVNPQENQPINPLNNQQYQSEGYPLKNQETNQQENREQNSYDEQQQRSSLVEQTQGSVIEEPNNQPRKPFERYTNQPQMESQNQQEIESQNQPQIESQNQPQIESQNQPQIESQNQPQIESQNQPQIESQNQPQIDSFNQKPIGSYNQPPLDPYYNQPPIDATYNQPPLDANYNQPPKDSNYNQPQSIHSKYTPEVDAHDQPQTSSDNQPQMGLSNQPDSNMASQNQPQRQINTEKSKPTNYNPQISMSNSPQMEPYVPSQEEPYNQPQIGIYKKPLRGFLKLPTPFKKPLVASYEEPPAETFKKTESELLQPPLKIEPLTQTQYSNKESQSPDSQKGSLNPVTAESYNPLDIIMAENEPEEEYSFKPLTEERNKSPPVELHKEPNIRPYMPQPVKPVLNKQFEQPLLNKKNQPGSPHHEQLIGQPFEQAPAPPVDLSRAPTVLREGGPRNSALNPSQDETQAFEKMFSQLHAGPEAPDPPPPSKEETFDEMFKSLHDGGVEESRDKKFETRIEQSIDQGAEQPDTLIGNGPQAYEHKGGGIQIRQQVPLEYPDYASKRSS